MQRFELHAVIAAIGARHGHKSKAQTARFLGVQEKTLSNWLHGRNYPSEATARELARLAGLDSEAFVAYVQALRATDPADKEMWLRIVRRLLAQGDGTAIFAAAIATDSVARELGPALA